MDRKNDFFQKKISNSRSFQRQKKESKGRIIFLIILLVILIGGFFGWKLFSQPTNLDNIEIETNKLSLGDQIFIKGELKGNGDIVTYSHSLEDETYGLVGLKSDDIYLYDYAGFVELTGMVVKYNKNIPILRVIQISGSIVESSNNVDIVGDENSGVYIMSAGIQFLPEFFENYVLMNEGENGEIKIQNTESGEDIVINYFRCNPSDPNRNCKGLKETFSETAVNSFVTSDGDTFYKLSEVQSWYISNGNRWGIFINDVSDDVIYNLKDLIKFANEKNINSWIKSRAIKLCKGEGEEMQKITNSEIILKQEGLIASISGDGKQKRVLCQVLVDFSLPSKGVLQSFTLGEDLKSDDNQNFDSIEPNNVENDLNNVQSESLIDYGDRDPNVQQFPIKSEGGLIYNSTRGGYTLQFPSSNISYVSSSTKENFGQSNLSCNNVISVIKYSDKDFLEISPTIRIYECIAKGDAGSIGNNYAIKRLGDKIFVIQINDSSWIDFVNNLKFSEL